jgi:uncharacterized membrane protein YgdD (TMEM256/DUF423 family)
LDRDAFAWNNDHESRTVMSVALTFAGLMGAAGVVLAAMAAHGSPDAGLGGASNMLLFHALAVLATGSLMASARLWRVAAGIAVVGWLIGVTLFAGDIAMRAFIGHRLFPMAAPTGGTILIGSWLVFAVAAAVRRRP